VPELLQGIDPAFVEKQASDNAAALTKDDTLIASLLDTLEERDWCTSPPQNTKPSTLN
jgi:hypothetical protein